MLADRLEEWALGYEAQGMEKGLQEGRQEGMQKGMQKGRQEGMQKGEALALQRLLAKRFGAIPTEIAANIAAAPQEQIQAWFDLAIDATTLDEVFRPTAR